MRRWQIAAVAASVLLVSSAGFAFLAATDQSPRSSASGASLSADRAPVLDRPLARPLTYAEGQTIHFGDRTIKTGLDVLSLDVTDDGAAFTTFDGQLWFTDGKTVSQIGLTSPGRVVPRGVEWYPAGKPNERIVADYSGSLLAWLEYPRIGEQSEPPELVVYDSHERRRVARVSLRPTNACPNCARIVLVHDDHVYWTNGPVKGLGTSMQRLSKTRLHRYDLSTGRQTTLSVDSYQTELRSRARTLVIGDSFDDGTVGDGVGEDFVLVDRSLVARGRGTGKKTFDPRTGRRIVFSAPSSLLRGSGGERFYLFQWLDDDTVALLDGSGWRTGKHRGEDMLLCTLSTGRCVIAPRRSASTGSPIVPEFETPGGAHAQARAARAQVLSDR